MKIVVNRNHPIIRAAPSVQTLAGARRSRTSDTSVLASPFVWHQNHVDAMWASHQLVPERYRVGFQANKHPVFK
jgi:hypothetical protein